MRTGASDNTTNVNSVSNWSLKFTSGFTLANSQDAVITTTGVNGSQAGTGTRGTNVTGLTGIVAAPVLASDNTLGSFSPYEGRIYMAYVDWSGDIVVNGYANPPDNTDIYLTYSDDGGQSWSSPIRVNDDFSPRTATPSRIPARRARSRVMSPVEPSSYRP